MKKLDHSPKSSSSIRKIQLISIHFDRNLGHWPSARRRFERNLGTSWKSTIHQTKKKLWFSHFTLKHEGRKRERKRESSLAFWENIKRSWTAASVVNSGQRLRSYTALSAGIRVRQCHQMNETLVENKMDGKYIQKFGVVRYHDFLSKPQLVKTRLLVKPRTSVIYNIYI